VKNDNQNQNQNQSQAGIHATREKEAAESRAGCLDLSADVEWRGRVESGRTEVGQVLIRSEGNVIAGEI
jgi:hypothetical protein